MQQTETTHAALTVIEADDADLPPIPDRAAMDEWVKRYDKGGEAAAGPIPHGGDAGHYQRIVLDTRRRTLEFWCSPWHTAGPDRYSAPNYSRGEHFAPFNWKHVPHLIGWVIDSGVEELPYLTAEQGNALVHRIAPLAQTLLDNLLPVAGTDELDWSAEAASAGHDITEACQRTPKPPRGRRPYLINMAEAVAVLPQMVKPEWADATDTQLDAAAASLTQYAFAPAWHPQLADLLQIPKEGASFRRAVVGTRAWLYAYRERQASDRRPLDAERWFTRAGHELDGRVSADATDENLERFAEAEQLAATAEGFKLIGTVDVLKKHRRRERERLFEELTTLGRTRTAAVAKSRLAQAAVRARITQIASWGVPGMSDNQAELARRGEVSRQAVDKMLDVDDEADE
ncbi:hypothetical protein P1P68_06025 [Streptomyces scabiei]|uniref:hypothetical protein n=1 Tax=Streptomyces scabiei TaxID=1930 RepID=UPI00298FAAD2|nr:hypothetical protein [Streptomyces scabiei]MDW8804360.1 hypothetical protein [Streptomyces scabiei]